MRLKLIACKALTRELSALSAKSGNNLDITYLRQGFHNTPELLRKMIQEEIDSIESGADKHTNIVSSGENPFADGDFDAILIGYGLCSNGIYGISSNKYRLVIPRAHDCITYFLGSKERYAEIFKKDAGSFWYTASWIENGGVPSVEKYESLAEHYRKKGYDEDDIEFLLENEKLWIKNYNYASYIKMPFYDDLKFSQFTKSTAEKFGWQYKEYLGSMSLLEAFVGGQWDTDRFLTVPPGRKVIPSYDESIITFE